MGLQQEAQHILPFVQAMAEGKTVQIRDKDTAWIDKQNIYGWDPTGEVMYRIKPEPKWRPYKTDELRSLIGKLVCRKECHHEAFQITGYTSGGGVIVAHVGMCLTEHLYEYYVFVHNGEPCGIPVEDA